MDTLKAISTRASIRKFKPDPVKPEDLKAILKAGMEAPSAVNKRPYAFVTITDKDRSGERSRSGRS
jgi:nitroreductase